MATIAEQLLGITSESNQKSSPDIAGGLVKGIELAQHAEQIANQRKQIEQAKADHGLQKYAKVMDAIKIADKSKDAGVQQSLFKYAIPNMVKALGVEDAFTQETLDLFAKSPEARQKAFGYQAELEDKVLNKGIPLEQAYKEATTTLGDQLSIASLDTDRLLKAQETAAAETQRNFRNFQTAQAALGKQVQAQEAAPQVAYKTKVAAEAEKFNASGGKAGLESKIKKIDDVIEQLKSGELQTRTAGALVTSAAGGRGQGLFLPKLKAAKAAINSAIDIKKILDSQFSDALLKETQQNLGLDENLKNEDNIKRLEMLRDQLKNEVNGKVDELKRLNLYRGEPGKIDVGGVSMTKEQARKFFQKNPQFLTDEKLKKDLGL